jgi:hypothetical protein
MTTDGAHVLIDELCGAPDAAADRAVEVLRAHAAALAWVRETTGRYPTSDRVASSLANAADRLRSGADTRDPGSTLIQVAAAALEKDRSDAA